MPHISNELPVVPSPHSREREHADEIRLIRTRIRQLHSRLNAPYKSTRSSSAPIRIAVGTGSAINRGVFGANDMLTADDAVLHNAAYRALVKALNIQSIRFPGGSHASFWDWETGHYIPVKEITRIWPETNHNWMLEHHPKTNALPAGTFSPIRIAGFAKELGVEIQWVPNLTTRARDQEALFAALKDAGIRVTHAEMDNEAYFWGAEFGEENRGENYIRRARSLSRAIRALFPEVKIGIVAREDDLFTSDRREPDPALDSWNDTIGGRDEQRDFDALILHHYIMRKGRLDSFEDDRARSEAFLAYPQVTLERAGRIIEKQFGGGMPMWITEYNVIAFYPQFAGTSPSDQWMVSRKDTGWAALYQAGFWLTGLCHPESIGILNHHSIASIDIGWGLGEPVDTQSGYLSKSGQLFSHLAHLSSQYQLMHPLELEGIPVLGFSIEGEDRVPAIHGAALTGRKGTALLIMNRSGAIQRATLGMKVPNGPVTRTIYLAEERQPGPDRKRVRFDSEVPVWEQGPMTAEKVRFSSGTPEALEFDLPEYSLTIVELGH